MTRLTDKVQHAVEEARILVVGTTVLIGFDYRSVFEQGFDKLPKLSQHLRLVNLSILLLTLTLLLLPAAYHNLPASSKNLHLVCLGFDALAIVLLIAPAAYHRIVHEGEDIEDVHRFASRMILAAMVPLALGLAGDLFIVTRKVTDSVSIAGIV